MTATDELRRLLDERGVEHYDGTETTLWGYEPTSESTGAYRIAADEISGGRMQVRMFNVTPTQAIEATLGPAVPPPPAPDQPPYDVLLDILASEWGIDASWDGLRRFWCVELNDEGVRKRDELHAENDKLRELVRIAGTYCVNGLCGKDDGCPLYLGKPYCALPDRMRELGIEVDE